LRLWLIEPPADPVAFTPEGELPGKAEFSRDGTRIAYARFSSSTPGIWTIGPAGETPAHVAGTVEGDEHPTWSPDGSRIAFVRVQGANSAGIFIVDSDGGVPVLIPGTAGFGEPSWSPDGRRIAATTQRFWGDEIATFAPDGTDLRELTNDIHEDLDPDWSPDSDELVFASVRPVPGFTVVRKRLYLMDADGSNVRLFTTPFGSNTSGTTVEDHHPSWSPDGRFIAFARSHQNSDRFVMTKELTADAAVPVTPLPDSEESRSFDFPDWQPIPRP
jgi:TolB protein